MMLGSNVSGTSQWNNLTKFPALQHYWIYSTKQYVQCSLTPERITLTIQLFLVNQTQSATTVVQLKNDLVLFSDSNTFKATSVFWFPKEWHLYAVECMLFL